MKIFNPINIQALKSFMLQNLFKVVFFKILDKNWKNMLGIGVITDVFGTYEKVCLEIILEDNLICESQF